MTQAAPSAIAITRAVTAVLRNDRGRLLAALVARLRDFQLAEDALQDAALAALSHWGRSGLPASPFGWLLKVAQRKALDRLRSGARAARHATEMALIAEDEAADPADHDAIPDERLRLIFACCHPALEEKTRVALTLRSLCGLTTAEVARVFLDTEPTMGQRLSRARAKITTAAFPMPCRRRNTGPNG
jgi:RNA polymerase sigma factor (sigma-70 family)